MTMGNDIQKQELVEQLLQKTAIGKAVQIPFAQDIMLAQMHVAGTAYYEAKPAAERLRVGQRLSLRREPGNVHDPLAIEVLEPEGRKLGYLPRAYNEIPARLMDAGKRLFVQMESIRKRGEWLEIQITLYMQDY